MLNLFSVVVFHRSMVTWGKEALVYVDSAICATYFGVVVFHTSMVDRRGVHLPEVYVYFALCYTYLV